MALCFFGLKFFGYDDGCYNVGYESASEAADGQDDPYEADNGGVDVKIFADSSAYAANHFVGS